MKPRQPSKTYRSFYIRIDIMRKYTLKSSNTTPRQPNLRHFLSIDGKLSVLEYRVWKSGNTVRDVYYNPRTQEVYSYSQIQKLVEYGLLTRLSALEAHLQQQLKPSRQSEVLHSETYESPRMADMHRYLEAA